MQAADNRLDGGTDNDDDDGHHQQVRSSRPGSRFMPVHADAEAVRYLCRLQRLRAEWLLMARTAVGQELMQPKSKLQPQRIRRDSPRRVWLK